MKKFFLTGILFLGFFPAWAEEDEKSSSPVAFLKDLTITPDGPKKGISATIEAKTLDKLWPGNNYEMKIKFDPIEARDSTGKTWKLETNSIGYSGGDADRISDAHWTYDTKALPSPEAEWIEFFGGMIIYGEPRDQKTVSVPMKTVEGHSLTEKGVIFTLKEFRTVRLEKEKRILEKKSSELTPPFNEQKDSFYEITLFISVDKEEKLKNISFLNEKDVVLTPHDQNGWFSPKKTKTRQEYTQKYLFKEFPENFKVRIEREVKLEKFIIPLKERYDFT